MSFNIAQKPRFKNVLDLVRNASKGCNPTNRKLIYNNLLGIIRYQKESDIFGLLFIGDVVTNSRNPLLDIMVSGKNISLSVIELVDCQWYLGDCEIKHGTFICCIFIEYMKSIDPDKSITDVVVLN